jgi:hypothetical protein
VPILESDLTRPMGLPGVPYVGDEPADEWARGLQSESAAREFREMRDSSTGGAVVALFRAVLASAEIQLSPPEGMADDPAAQAEVRRWTEEITRLEHLRAQLGEIAENAATYGASVSEIIVELDRSGRWRTLDLEIRAADTLRYWHVDERDRPVRVEQVLADGRRAWIDLGRVVHWTLGTHNRSPVGRSILRAGWGDWRLAQRAKDREAIGIDRDMTGVPFITAPLAVMNAQAGSGSDASRVRANLERSAQRMQAGAAAGLIFPAEKEGGQETGYTLRPFPSPGAGRLVPDVTIRRLESRVLQSCFASFLELGLTSGSRALAGPQINLFMRATGSALASLLARLRRDWIARVIAWEGRDPRLAPVLTAAPLDAPDLGEIVEILSKASGAGLVIPSDTIARWLLGMLPGAPTDAGEALADPRVDAAPDATTGA